MRSDRPEPQKIPRLTHSVRRFAAALALGAWFGGSAAPAAAAPPPNGVDPYDWELRVNRKNIPAAELLPEQASTQAVIRVYPHRVLAELNPLFIGYNIEDLSHAFFPGLYAQMLYGESFEDEPDIDLPSGWKAWLEPRTPEVANDPAKLQKWRGAWAFEDGVVTLCGARQRRIFTSQIQMTNGTVECELLQPSAERNYWGPGLLVCWGPAVSYFVHLSAERGILELLKSPDPNFPQGGRRLATRELPLSYDQWHKLKVVVQAGRITVYLGGREMLSASDAEPLSGGVGLESSFCVGRFRNLKVTPAGPAGGAAWEPDFHLRDRPYTHKANISRWWDPVVAGAAQARYRWDRENPYNTDHSQQVEFTSGKGTAGVANTGLHNWGLTFRQGWNYQGRLYLRGDYAGEVTLALQSAGGSRTYATQKLRGIGRDWKRFEIALPCRGTETNGRFALWINQPGRIWVDQVILMPGEAGLYKGLPVRRDLAEKLMAGMSHIRFGGDMINVWAFDWKKMLAPPDQRRQYLDGWNYHKSAQFMIFEFLDLCRAAGVEPIVNFGEHTPPGDIVEFVEYCNGEATTKWGRSRVESGRRDPYGLKYLMYGNGLPGVGQLKSVATALKEKWPGARLISGDIGHVPWVNIARTAPALAGEIDALSPLLEAVASRPEVSELGSQLVWSDNIELTLAKFPGFAGRGRPFFYAEEVNSGHHNWQRGLSDALFIMTSEKAGKTVWANSFCTALQASGHLYEWDEGHIHFTSGESWYQPSGWAARLLGEHFQPIVLECQVEGPTTKVIHPAERGSGERTAPALWASATRDRDGRALVLKVVNLWGGPVQAALALGELRPKMLQVITLGSRHLKGVNTATDPDYIAPRRSTVANPAAQMNYTFEPASFTILRFNSN